MKFGSLFSGIGGLDLGLERAGMECAWQVEIDDYCQKILTKHWPDVPKYKDIRDVGKELGSVDLICGGFPCQPFSVAGKRKGTADDRHLWPEMLRVISELKPTWVLGENVPGIINIFLDQAISDLEAEGYAVEAYVLPAAAFDAPHRRDRLFIVAYTERNEYRRENSARIEKKGEDAERIGQKNSTTRELGRASQLRLSDNRYAEVQQGILENTRREHGQGGSKPGKSNREESEGPTLRHQSPSGTSRPVSDTAQSGQLRTQQLENDKKDKREGRGQNADKDNTLGRKNKGGQAAKWLPEPGVGRVAHGIPSRVDRLRGLGNAVVPQVAEFIGRQILKVTRKQI